MRAARWAERRECQPSGCGVWSAFIRANRAGNIPVLRWCEVPQTRQLDWIRLATMQKKCCGK